MILLDTVHDVIIMYMCSPTQAWIHPAGNLAGEGKCSNGTEFCRQDPSSENETVQGTKIQRHPKTSYDIIKHLEHSHALNLSTDADTLNCCLASLFARCRHGIQVVTFLASELLGLHGKRGSIGWSLVYFVVPCCSQLDLY